MDGRIVEFHVITPFEYYILHVPVHNTCTYYVAVCSFHPTVYSFVFVQEVITAGMLDSVEGRIQPKELPASMAALSRFDVLYFILKIITAKLPAR
jgi:hypothetical protein